MNICRVSTKTKYNTFYTVAGPNGPAKYKNMSSNTFLMLRNGLGQDWGRQIPRTRIQRGRWNHSYSNTKLHPAIGILADNAGNPIGYKQANNLFMNTDYKMTKTERLTYFSKNRHHLLR